MAPTDNLTAVLYKAKDLRMENRPVPVPGDNDVLLKMACVGICGSDVHYLKEGRCCTFIVKKPMVCGHEGSGVVAEVGKNVKHLKPGDRVAIEPGVPCLSCNFCITGRYNLCPDIFFCATPPDDGNLCRYYRHNAAFCHKLPENVSNEEGALMEPLSVGVHACRQGKVEMGKNVLITGSGPIGLVSLVAARAMGANKIIVTDVVEHRLQVAKAAGADEVVLVSKGTQEDHINQIKAALGGDLPEITLDCTGFEASIRLCLEATKSGGTIVIVGMGAHEVTIPIATALAREVTIKGVFRYCNDYPLAIKMVETGKVNVKQFITHHFKLEETIEAFDTACTGRGNPIKIMIHCNN